MSRSRRTLRIALVPALAGLAGCAWLGVERVPDPAEARALADQARAIFGPLPGVAESPANPITEAKVELGRMLYYEARLSRSHEISCNSCHMLDRFGVDGEATSPGHKGQRGDRNSPSTYNAALHVAQFWDGRAADVEEQSTGPMMNPVEMAMPGPEQVIQTLVSIPGYGEAFREAFPDDPRPVNLGNVALAIGAFERGLLTPGPLDRFMEGDLEALDAAQQRGLRTFVATGCTTCHNGTAVGGAMFQKLGLVHAYETEDVGREKVTGAETDRFVFKVPSLRNVAETGPWFHDGSVKSLDEAVRLMAWHQLGRELTGAEVRDILAFLGSLTGEIDWGYVAAPELPMGSAATPKPDRS